MLTLEEVKSLKEKGYNLFPLQTQMLADLDTPLSAFIKLKGLGANMLLESVEGGEKWGRFSVIGLGRLVTVKSKKRFGEVNRLGQIEVKEVKKDPLYLLKECKKVMA